MSYYDPYDDDQTEQSAGDYSTYGGSNTSYAPSGPVTPPTPAPRFTSGPKYYAPPNGNTGVSGYGFGGQTMPQSSFGDPSNPEAFIRSVLGSVPYGAGGLKSLKDTFGQQGYNVWTDANQGARGIITDPRGQNWNVLDPNESMNWWTNQTGQNWDVRQYGSGSGGGASSVLNDAIARLTGMFGQSNAGLDRFMGLAEGRLKQLQDPAMTDAQRATMRTNLQEPMEAQRAAAQQRVLERASARGLGLGSGVIEQEAQGVDQGIDRMLGEGFRGLSIDEMNRNEARGQEAVSIGQMMANLASAQQGMQMNAANSLLGAGQYLTNLPMQQLASATSSMNSLDNQTIPQQADMSSLIGLLLSLSGQGQNAYNMAGAQDSNFWNGIFGQLPGILGAVMGTSGDRYARNAGDYNPNGPNYA